MSNRKALLIGTMPFENEEQAMEKAISILGKHLISVPDGEIGEKNEQYPTGSRSSWVCINANECAEDTENWEIIQKAEMNQFGFPAGYDKIYPSPKAFPRRTAKVPQFALSRILLQELSHLSTFARKIRLARFKISDGHSNGINSVHFYYGTRKSHFLLSSLSATAAL